ncbi:MAG: hypothetical protein NZ908_02650 [Candidatus Micrarchaeota archaeon]|nr:hypothetical protein [Candidatus Micrarchaeota archaeon]MCX8154334.1 hypothetical protein [Candidatus Micrarchaeota archaeon]
MDPVGIEVGYELIPIRASSTDDFIVMIVSLKNPTKTKKLISVDIISNNDQISLDNYRVKKKEEFRVGFMGENDTKEIPVKLYLQRPRAKPGVYPISIITYLHDRDYNSYIERNEIRVDVRVV